MLPCRVFQPGPLSPTQEFTKLEEAVQRTLGSDWLGSGIGPGRVACEVHEAEADGCMQRMHKAF